jgi:hypothetical protein
MPDWLWSYLLTATGIGCIYLQGKKLEIGWLLAVFAQVLWIAYAFASKQYGFIGAAIAYGSMFFLNWRRWRAEPSTK